MDLLTNESNATETNSDEIIEGSKKSKRKRIRCLCQQSGILKILKQCQRCLGGIFVILGGDLLELPPVQQQQILMERNIKKENIKLLRVYYGKMFSIFTNRKILLIKAVILNL